MTLRRRIIDDLVIWEYHRLCFLGVHGRLDKPLGKLAEVYRDSEEIEFGPVERKGKKRILTGLYYNPPVDLYLEKGEKACIIASSVNKRQASEVLNEIVGRSGFETQNPDENFVRSIELTLDVEPLIKGYETIARKLRIRLEQAYGFSKYVAFLTMYRRLSWEESVKKAFKRYIRDYKQR